MKTFKLLRFFCAFALLSAFVIAVEKQCEVKDFDMESYTRKEICFYPKQTLLEAYADFRKTKIKSDSNDSGYENLRTKLEIGKNYNDQVQGRLNNHNRLCVG